MVKCGHMRTYADVCGHFVGRRRGLLWEFSRLGDSGGTGLPSPAEAGFAKAGSRLMPGMRPRL
uniref:Uncharacterized protein n=1 Tax=uncultured marine microorganism HF4000_APKG2J17 TaxID=455546 RepID=B3T6L9_9ZZZZ|nr:hypothetical protein ALOHA_HF4000APKG2J17ctg1g35 [uncultured marine microorganism HF4000_APKG2J17]